MTLDGGNVVTCYAHRVMTDKVFQENGRVKYAPEFIQDVTESLGSEILFLPWHCDNPQEPNADVYGHADGLVHWAGDNGVLMSNHRDSFPEEADEIKYRLEAVGFEVIEMLFDVPNPNRDFNWAYINYLQVGSKIIVPTFGIPEDKQALKYIRDANPGCVVRGFRMRDIAKNGGALHCITWNIKK
jgi:agmatine/peptidylarginine deiminase